MKKAQTEIIGLTIVIILIIIGLTFVYRFIITKEPVEFKKEITQAELASNMLNTFLTTTSKDCNELSMTELLRDCNQNPSNPKIRCTANNVGSCEYVEQEAIKIFTETLEKWNVGYEFRVSNKNNDEEIINFKRICPGEKTSKTYPLPTSSGLILAKLDIGSSNCEGLDELPEIDAEDDLKLPTPPPAPILPPPPPVATGGGSGGGSSGGSGGEGGGSGSGGVPVAPPPLVVPPPVSPPPTTLPSELIPAFPGAEGFGALALNNCDRNDIKLIEVTNLNGDGPGSFRDAIDNQLRDGKLDIIIFRTGGTIVGGAGNIRNSCVYIAGQTAPGDGIQVHSRGNAFSIAGDSRGNNIVMRYLRLRSEKFNPAGPDVMTIRGGHDIILDHVSLQWGNDEVLTINQGKNSDISPHDITFQRLFVAEGLKGHSTGSIIGGNYDDQKRNNPTYRISIHHNIYAHNSHRNPNIAANDVQFANNIIYNWNNHIGYTARDSIADYANNVYTKGPWSRGSDRDLLRHASCDFSQDGSKPAFAETPLIYIEGNIFSSTFDPFSLPDADQWIRIRQRVSCLTDYTRGEELPLSWRRNNPILDAPVPVTLQSANNARASVLADVGANRRLACNGDWVWVQDSVDSDIITHIQTGTGPSGGPDCDCRADECGPIPDLDCDTNEPADYGGFPVLDPGTPCADADGDGMPDAWEQRYFGSKTAAVINQDPDNDGYTNIEEYINGERPVP